MSAFPTPLTPKQIQTTLQQITCTMLGLSPISPTDPAYAKVRIGWPTEGQPAWKITEDVVFIRCVEEDDQYNRVRDRFYLDGGVQEVTQYTRVWRVYWTVYGPNSFDNARILRSQLFEDAIGNLFSASQLYLVTDPSAPARIPEQRDGQWWERVDFSARFNENVNETYTAQTVESVEIIIETFQGVQADFTVES